MTSTCVAGLSRHEMERHHGAGAFLRTVVIGLTAFLTVVDLFATQAILPSLVRAYDVSPAAMGFAVNASTMGMAVARRPRPRFTRATRRRPRPLLRRALPAVAHARLSVPPR